MEDSKIDQKMLTSVRSRYLDTWPLAAQSSLPTAHAASGLTHDEAANNHPSLGPANPTKNLLGR